MPSQIKVKRKEKNLELMESIVARIRQSARGFIGEANAISSHELFFIAYQKYPNDYPFYERMFYWELLKSALKYLKKTEILIIINKPRRHFVLQSMDEWHELDKKININIQNLRTSSEKARDWVLKEKWKEILK